MGHRTDCFFLQNVRGFIDSIAHGNVPLAVKIMLQQAPILLAEDNQNDVYLMRRAFAEAAIPNQVLVVKNGREAVDYLAGKGDYAQRDKYPLPGLMLLDLKMPWMDGFDVLSWLRRRPEFHSLPVVVLTSSRLQCDIDQSRLMGAYDYRVKPTDLPELVALLDNICKRWLGGKKHSGETPAAPKRNARADPGEGSGTAVA